MISSMQSLKKAIKIDKTQIMHLQEFQKLSENVRATILMKQDQTKFKFGIFADNFLINQYPQQFFKYRCRKYLDKNSIQQSCVHCTDSLPLCQQCFDQKQHTDHLHHQSKQENIVCCKGWIFQFDQAQIYQQSLQNIFFRKKTFQYIKYYQQCLKLHRLLVDSDLKQQAQQYNQNLCIYLEQKTKYNKQFYHFFKQLVTVHSKSVLSNQQCIEDLETVFQNQWWEKNFYKSFLKLVFKLQLHQVKQVYNCQYYSLIAISALSDLNQQNLQVSDAYLNKFLMIINKLIKNALDTDGFNKKKQVIAQILCKLDRIGVFTAKSKNVSFKNRDQLLRLIMKLISQKNIQNVFINLIKMKFISLLQSQNVSETNLFVKKIIVFLKLKQQNFAKFFKQNKFDRLSVSQFIFYNIRYALKKGSKDFSILTLRCITLLIQQYQLGQQLAKMLQIQKQKHEKWDQTIHNFLQILLTKQSGFLSSIYNIKIQRNLWQHLEPVDVRVQDKRRIDWLHSYCRNAKQISVKDLGSFRRYINGEMIENFIQNYCKKVAQQNKFIYIGPAENHFNPDIVLKTLLQHDFNLNCNQQIINTIPSYLLQENNLNQVLQKVFESQLQDCRRKYLSILLKDIGPLNSLQQIKKIKKKDLLHHLRIYLISNWILIGKNPHIRNYTCQILERTATANFNQSLYQLVGIDRIQKIMSNQSDKLIIRKISSMEGKKQEEKQKISEKALKIKLKKQKLKLKAKNFMDKNIGIENKEQQMEENPEHFCIVCRQSSKKAQLYYLASDKVIKMSKIVQKDSFIHLHSCLHIVHQKCMNKNTCPLCRDQKMYLIPVRSYNNSLIPMNIGKMNSIESFHVFFNTYLYMNGIGYFNKNSQKNLKKLQIGQYIKPYITNSGFDFRQTIKKKYHQICQNLKKIEHKFFRYVKQIALCAIVQDFIGSNQLPEIRQKIKYAFREIMQNFSHFGQTRQFLQHLGDSFPNIKNHINIQETKQVSNTSNYFLTATFEFQLPQSLLQANRWRGKCQYQQNEDQYCLICKHVFCQNHRKQGCKENSHKNEKIQVDLQSGCLYYYLGNRLKINSIYFNIFGEKYNVDKQKLVNYKLDKQQFEKHLQKWAYSE